MLLAFLGQIGAMVAEGFIPCPRLAISRLYVVAFRAFVVVVVDGLLL